MDIECVSGDMATPEENAARAIPVSSAEEGGLDKQPKHKIPMKLIPPVPHDDTDPDVSDSEEEDEEEEEEEEEVC